MIYIQKGFLKIYKNSRTVDIYTQTDLEVNPHEARSVGVRSLLEFYQTEFPDDFKGLGVYDSDRKKIVNSSPDWSLIYGYDESEFVDYDYFEYESEYQSEDESETDIENDESEQSSSDQEEN